MRDIIVHPFSRRVGNPPPRLRIHTAFIPGVMALCTLTACDTAPPDQPQPISPGTTLGGPGGRPGEFSKPRAIDSHDGILYIVDRSGRIQALDAETGLCVAYWRIPDTKLGYPTGITIAPSPRNDGTMAVWVPDTHFQRVLVYAMPALVKPGARVDEHVVPLITQFGAYGTGPGQFTYPSDVAVTTDPTTKRITRIYVSEFGRTELGDRVSIFTVTDGTITYAGEFNGAGGTGTGGTGVPPVRVTDASHTGGTPVPPAVSGMDLPPPPDDNTPANPNYFQRPQCLAVDDSGDLFIADSINHRIGHFKPDGTLIQWFGRNKGDGTSGKGPGEFCHPRGILLLHDGTGLVVEFGNNRVQRINLTTGAGIGLWGQPGTGPGELAEPWAIAAVGNMGYIVDARNHRLVAMKLPK